MISVLDGILAQTNKLDTFDETFWGQSEQILTQIQISNGTSDLNFLQYPLRRCFHLPSFANTDAKRFLVTAQSDAELDIPTEKLEAIGDRKQCTIVTIGLLHSHNGNFEFLVIFANHMTI